MVCGEPLCRKYSYNIHLFTKNSKFCTKILFVSKILGGGAYPQIISISEIEYNNYIHMLTIQCIYNKPKAYVHFSNKYRNGIYRYRTAQHET